MRRVIFNQKGAVGKISITCNSAAASAHRGYSTLVVDLDIQGHSSEYLMGNEYKELEDNTASFSKRHLMEFIYGTSLSCLRIFMDTPPTLDFYSQSALIAAESLLTPFDCDSFSQHGLYNLLETVKEIKVDHNQSLQRLLKSPFKASLKTCRNSSIINSSPSIPVFQNKTLSFLAHSLCG